VVSLPNDGDGPGRVKNWCKMEGSAVPIRYYRPNRWLGDRWCRAGVWFRLSDKRASGMVNKSYLTIWLRFDFECVEGGSSFFINN
jgi:hypothetical protein